MADADRQNGSGSAPRPRKILSRQISQLGESLVRQKTKNARVNARGQFSRGQTVGDDKRAKFCANQRRFRRAERARSSAAAISDEFFRRSARAKNRAFAPPPQNSRLARQGCCSRLRRLFRFRAGSFRGQTSRCPFWLRSSLFLAVKRKID